jgi:hypothetical protein
MHAVDDRRRRGRLDHHANGACAFHAATSIRQRRVASDPSCRSSLPDSESRSSSSAARASDASRPAREAIRRAIAGPATGLVCSEANTRPRPQRYLAATRREPAPLRVSSQDRAPQTLLSRNTLAETLRRRVRIRIFASDPLCPTSASQRLCERSFFFLGDRRFCVITRPDP